MSLYCFVKLRGINGGLKISIKIEFWSPFYYCCSRATTLLQLILCISQSYFNHKMTNKIRRIYPNQGILVVQLVAVLLGVNGLRKYVNCNSNWDYFQ